MAPPQHKPHAAVVPRYTPAVYRRRLHQLTLALYLAAPTLAGQSDFGEGLMDLRAGMDQARLWLQDRAAALIR